MNASLSQNIKSNVILFMVMVALLVTGCQKEKTSTDYHPNHITQPTEIHTIVSDDSVITVCWWATDGGGTAEVIESECSFIGESGKLIKYKKPLLEIIHPDFEYSHHEVERIISYRSEFGQTAFIFFLRSKADSNVYSHNIIALQIEGDSLVPANIFDIGNSDSADINIHTTW